MSMDSNGPVYIGPLPVEKKPPPLVLAADSWQARMVRAAEAVQQGTAIPVVLSPNSWEERLVLYLRRLHLTRKPQTIILRLGDCRVNWMRGVSEGGQQ